MKTELTPLETATGFQLKPYLKCELAQLYSPHLSLRSAMNKLNRWIRINPDLQRELYNGREGKYDVAFSLRQVRLLVRYLGEP